MVKMGVAQKTMFSILDRLAKFFGISGAPMEHNAIAKSKQTFFLQIRHKRPRTIRLILLQESENKYLHYQETTRHKCEHLLSLKVRVELQITRLGSLIQM